MRETGIVDCGIEMDIKVTERCRERNLQGRKFVFLYDLVFDRMVIGAGFLVNLFV